MCRNLRLGRYTVKVYHNHCVLFYHDFFCNIIENVNLFTILFFHFNQKKKKTNLTKINVPKV